MDTVQKWTRVVRASTEVSWDSTEATPSSSNSRSGAAMISTISRNPSVSSKAGSRCRSCRYGTRGLYGDTSTQWPLPRSSGTMLRLAGNRTKTWRPFFLSRGDHLAAVDEFVEWLRTRPEGLGQAIARIAPESVAPELGLDTWNWVDHLTAASTENQADESAGSLTRAAESFERDMVEIERAIGEAEEEGRLSREGRSDAASRQAHRRALWARIGRSPHQPICDLACRVSAAGGCAFSISATPA